MNKENSKQRLALKIFLTVFLTLGIITCVYVHLQAQSFLHIEATERKIQIGYGIEQTFSPTQLLLEPYLTSPTTFNLSEISIEYGIESRITWPHSTLTIRIQSVDLGKDYRISFRLKSKIYL